MLGQIGALLREYWFNAVSLALGLGGVCLAMRSRKERKPCCAYRWTLVQARHHKAVEIFFNGTPVQNLHRLRFAFWNAGRLEIRDSDLVGDCKPFLQLPDSYAILSVDLSAAREGTKPRIASLPVEGARELRFDFAFLNPKDSFVIEVLFDGPAARPAIEVGGEIVGAPPIQRMQFGGDLGNSMLVAALGTALFSLVSGAVAGLVWSGQPLNPEPTLPRPVVAIGAAAMSALLAWASVSIVRDWWNNQGMPRHVRAFLAG